MEFIISILKALSKIGTTTRSVVKQLLHRITGQCELERLCQTTEHGFKQCQEIEYCLYHSKHEDIQKILVADSAKVKNVMQTILRIKRIVPDKDLIFLSSMPQFIRKIVSYNAVLTETDNIRSIAYDEENEEHEALLQQLWSLLKNDDKLTERYTKRWGEIGFQGKNPATDFRGMGLLGLKNLVFLLEKFSDVGLKIFGQSNHPKYGFSFAIMGISFTGVSFELLRNGRLKGYMYNLNSLDYNLENYQTFFVELLAEFSDYWLMREPPNIMFFNEIKGDFMKNVNTRLESGSW